MNEISLNFQPVIENKDLVSKNVYDVISNWKIKNQIKEFLVAEIDPNYAGRIEFCEKYNINPEYGANCLIVDGVRGDRHTYAILLLLPNAKILEGLRKKG